MISKKMLLMFVRVLFALFLIFLKLAKKLKKMFNKRRMLFLIFLTYKNKTKIIKGVCLLRFAFY